MSLLKVPDAQLYYEVDGAGPLLILIPGANGTAEAFRSVARDLSARYQVVIYDRRGFFRSRLDGTQDYARRLFTDADDVRRLIEHLTDQPAIVFGNSSGAIVALEVLIHSPERVHTVVAHEPPAVNLLPDAAQWRAFFDGVYNTYRRSGISPAMQQFVAGIAGSADRPIMERSAKEQPDERSLADITYWMEHELRQYTRVDLDLDALAAHAGRLVLAGGRDSQDQMPYQPNRVLAQKLGLDIADFPGGHLGFVVYPTEFAKKLVEVLEVTP